jgi:hypothetical protein
MKTDTVTKVFIFLSVVFILIIVGISVLDNQVGIWNKYENAPVCNETRTVGLCKLSNTSWLNCEKSPTNGIMPQWENIVMCQQIELYDVRT